MEDGNDENVSHNTPRDSSDTKTSTEASTPVAKASEHTFKLQVMIELIRMHIIANNAKLKADQRSSSSAASRSSTSAAKDNWNPAISSDSESVSDAYVSDGADSEDSQDSLDELFDDLPEFIQKGKSDAWFTCSFSVKLFRVEIVQTIKVPQDQEVQEACRYS